MAFPAGKIVFGNSVHRPVTACTFNIALLEVMTSHAAFMSVRLVHGRIQSNPLAIFGPCQRMTFVAGVKTGVMAYPAGIGIGFMCLMIKRRKIHPALRLHWILADLDQNRIRLLSLYSGDIRNFFNPRLTLRVMTAAALYGACLFTGGKGFPMAGNTGHMGSQTVGNPVLFRNLTVTITAGAFLSFGVKQLLGLFIVFVVTKLTFIVFGPGMTEMEGFVHGHRLSDRHHSRFFSVAVSAGDRPRFFPGGRTLLMTSNAAGMIYIHHFFFGTVFQPFKPDRKPIFFRKMACRAILMIFLQNAGMGIVQKNNRRPLQFAKSFQRIDGNDIRTPGRSSRRRIPLSISTDTRNYGNSKRQKNRHFTKQCVDIPHDKIFGSIEQPRKSPQRRIYAASFPASPL
jgi:hypothetical protein